MLQTLQPKSTDVQHGRMAEWHWSVVDEERLCIKGEEYWKFCQRKSANKRLQRTKTALGHFGIIARHYGLGGGIGLVLPVRARFWPLNRGVSALVAGIAL